MYISDLYEDDLEVSIKVVIVGNGAVGKSSMIQRYCRGIFTQNYKKTIGVDFLEKHLRISGEDVRLMLWDTAGQEEFDAITKAYYRGAQACVVAFSTTDRASFDAVRKWKKKVEDECGHVPMVLVQNKIDLLHEAQVATEEVDRVSKELCMRLYRTSVKEDLNVCSVFQHLAENYVNRVRSFTDVYADLSGMSGPGGLSGGYSTGVSRGHQLPLVQIGVGRPYVTNIGRRPLESNGGNAVALNGNSGSNNNNNNNKKHSSSHLSPASMPSFYGYASFSPQDYLNNPMFDTLHQHRNRSRYAWATGDRTITLRPLGNLTKKGININKKLATPFNKNSCKVL